MRVYAPGAVPTRSWYPATFPCRGAWKRAVSPPAGEEAGANDLSTPGALAALAAALTGETVSPVGAAGGSLTDVLPETVVAVVPLNWVFMVAVMMIMLGTAVSTVIFATACPVPAAGVVQPDAALPILPVAGCVNVYVPPDGVLL